MGVGTLYLPPPPPLDPGQPCRARSVHGAWVERWGRGRGRSGHRRAPFYPPSPGAAPKKKGAGGRGVEGGVIIPNTKPALAPTRPHPCHGQKAQKVRGLDGSGKGVGRGGTSTSLSAFGDFEDRHLTCVRFFFWGGARRIFGIKTGGNAAVFFFLFWGGRGGRWIYHLNFSAIRSMQFFY